MYGQWGSVQAIRSIGDHGTRREWGVSVAPRPLFTHRKDPVPIEQEAGLFPGPLWTGAENFTPTGIRSPDRLACSQLLYWIRYPAHKFCMVVPNICGSSEWNLLYVILLAPGILKWFLDFWKIFALVYSYIHTYMHPCTYACRYTTHMTACHGQLFNPLVVYSIWQVWDFSVAMESSCSNWCYSSITAVCADQC